MTNYSHSGTLAGHTGERGRQAGQHVHCLHGGRHYTRECCCCNPILMASHYPALLTQTPFLGFPPAITFTLWLPQGVIYLHESPIRFHGSLCTSNCLVDSRWVVKLTDFGLFAFKQGIEESSADMQHMTAKCLSRSEFATLTGRVL